MSSEIERFHSCVASSRANLLERKKVLTKEKSSTPKLVWHTNMAVISLFWDTNMSAVTSREKQ